MHDRYRIPMPEIPDEDRSGPLGPRLLALLTGQAERDLSWLQTECEGRAISPHDYLFLFREPTRRPAHPLHVMYQVGGCALQLAVLALFGPKEAVAGRCREELRATALGLIRALCATHPVADPLQTSNVTWDRFSCLRHDFVLGLAAWLLWDEVDAATRVLVARLLEHDADLWCGFPAPAQLYDDTQAESNAWSSSGMALAYCLLKHHPRREVWGERAKELMISAYATEADVSSERLVDGKPLSRWLTGPNAFEDHTVENHGIVHGDYLAAISEQVRTAIVYRLAGEPIPEAVLFNAREVLQRLMFLGLPDGTHLHMQGSDYIARRLDSFYQACNIVPLIDSPAGSAAFVRALDALEHMQRKGPHVPTSGWLGSAFELGVHWGTVENYLMRRLLGPGATPLPDEELNAALAGVHVCEPARYAVHRTETTLSSFSWHTTTGASQVMGLTMALDRDVLVAPVPPGSYLGRLFPEDGACGQDQVISCRVTRHDDGCGVVVQLERCGGRVLQQSAFICLPDGTSVYLETRRAQSDLSILSATSGNIAVFDDLRGPYQLHDRVYRSASGVVTPDDTLHIADWVNVDDRLGLVAVGAKGFRLRLASDYMHSPYGDQYRLGLLSFVSATTSRHGATDKIGAFALLTCPHQSAACTGTLAARVADAGWHTETETALALIVGGRLVHADFETGQCGWTDLQN